MRFSQSAALTVLVALFAVLPTARADNWNKKTYLTVNDPIEIPGGKVLTPGEYVMKLLDSQSDRHIVQFFDKDETRLIATVLATPNQRSEPTSETELTLYEAPADQPQALRSWFYPGDTIGQEFTYQNHAEELAKTSRPLQQRQASVADISKPADNLKTPSTSAETRDTQPQASKQPVEIAQAREQPEQPQEVAQATQAPAEAQNTPPPATEADESLPTTAGSGPLLGLIGLLSLGTAAAVRKLCA